MLAEVNWIPTSQQDRVKQLLPAFLSVYWLRPENAVWMVLRSLALQEADEGRIDLDLGCGDGVFSFIHAGGRLNPSFDVFESVGHLNRVKNHHVDMFNHVGSDYQPQITKAPDEGCQAGTDHKPALLAKAQRLQFYQELVLQDHNEPLAFANDQFRSIYCNTLYWVGNVDGFLSEIARICQAGGRVIVQVKLDAIRRCTLEGQRHQLGERLLRILGRGRFDTWTSLADRITWERRFHQAGLTIESVESIATASHARIWDIGLRPVAPLLIKMANHLEPETRLSIKEEWVELLLEPLEPLCNTNLNLVKNGAEPVELQYVLTPMR